MATKRVRKSEVMDVSEAEVMDSGVGKGWRVGGTKGRWIAIVIVVLAGVGFWMYKTDNLPIVAMVGWRPITRYQVDRILFQQGGKMEVDELVSERIVRDELSQERITVSDDELNQRLSAIQQSLGQGQDLNSALAAQGMTLEDLKSQLQLQLGVEKAVASQAAVSDADVASYISSNAATLTATTEAGQKDEAALTLKQQKMQTAISNWVQAITAKAKVWKAPGL